MYATQPEGIEHGAIATPGDRDPLGDPGPVAPWGHPGGSALGSPQAAQAPLYWDPSTGPSSEPLVQDGNTAPPPPPMELGQAFPRGSRTPSAGCQGECRGSGMETPWAHGALVPIPRPRSPRPAPPGAARGPRLAPLAADAARAATKNAASGTGCETTWHQKAGRRLSLSTGSSSS